MEGSQLAVRLSVCAFLIGSHAVANAAEDSGTESFAVNSGATSYGEFTQLPLIGRCDSPSAHTCTEYRLREATPVFTAHLAAICEQTGMWQWGQACPTGQSLGGCYDSASGTNATFYYATGPGHCIGGQYIPRS